jgi:hypothetical protein
LRNKKSGASTAAARSRQAFFLFLAAKCAIFENTIRQQLPSEHPQLSNAGDAVAEPRASIAPSPPRVLFA